MKNQKGQALIELIIFLPLMITLYSVIGGFANSINASINQQKITRAYFYNRIQNNSTIPGPRLVRNEMASWRVFGMFFIGWKDYFKGGNVPVMPCFKVSIPFRDSPNDKCEDAYQQEKTLYVRVGTVYGICGSTYLNVDNKIFYVPESPQSSFNTVVDRTGCTIGN